MSGSSQITQTTVVSSTVSSTTIASTETTKLPEEKTDQTTNTNSIHEYKQETQPPPSSATPHDTNIIQSIIYGCKEKGAKAYQEDSFCIFHSPDLSVLVAGIFDGHGGINGQVASQTVSRLCSNYFEKHWKECKLWTNDEWQKNMTLMFEDFHFKVRQQFIALETERRKANCLNLNNIVDGLTVRKPSGFPMHGGTTCTIVTILRMGNKWRIITANVGDSDALFLARKPGRLKENNKCMHLSIDHSPDNADEFLRIQRLDNQRYPQKLMFIYDQANMNRKFECPIVFLKDGTKDPKYVRNPWGNHLRPTNVRYDPAVYAVTPFGIAHDITCIAMTRSLGDFYAHQFGITCEPSVTVNEFDIVDHEYIIAVGSDGIWDCWKWDDFSDYVNGMMTKYNCNLSKTTAEVLRHTIQRAKACFGVKSYDDASLVFISLRSQMFDVNNVSCLVPSEFTISSSSNNSSASTDSMFSQQQSSSNISVSTDITVSSGSGNVHNTNKNTVGKVKSVDSEIRGLDDSD